VSNGVRMLPPPPAIRDQIEALVVREAQIALKPGQKGAFVAVADRKGINIAVVGWVPGGFQVQGWFGKSYSGDVNVEIRTIKTW
jgi:hypothetical protein